MLIMVRMEKLEKVSIGREKEINEIIRDVKSNKGTKLLMVGESGIGNLLY
jgi:ATP-dependent Clp protease ATP-binding subunit ClpA